MQLKLTDVLDVVTRESSWEWIRKNYHKNELKCPACCELITGKRALQAWGEMRRVYCSGCSHKFEATTGTPIHGTTWSPEQFMRCLLLVAKGGSSAASVSSLVGKSEACVRDMVDRIRIHHADSDVFLLPW